MIRYDICISSNKVHLCDESASGSVIWKCLFYSIEFSDFFVSFILLWLQRFLKNVDMKLLLWPFKCIFYMFAFFIWPGICASFDSKRFNALHIFDDIHFLSTYKKKRIFITTIPSAPSRTNLLNPIAADNSWCCQQISNIYF